MPTRLIAFEALWSSDKIAQCAAWAQAEYAWLYGLADAHGSFEITNRRVIHGKVAANRKDLSLERLEQILSEFQNCGLLFVWAQDGKLFGHWTNSEIPGRLPPPSVRKRYKPLAPTVPPDWLAEYMEVHKSPNPQLHVHLNDASMTPHTQDLDTELVSGTDTGKARKTKAATASPPQSVSAFDDFWKSYPRKEAKPRAVKAWKKISEADYPKISADVQRRKQTEDWQREEGKFVPYPAKYLSERRWEDSPRSLERSSTPDGTPELEHIPWVTRK